MILEGESYIYEELISGRERNTFWSYYLLLLIALAQESRVLLRFLWFCSCDPWSEIRIKVERESGTEILELDLLFLED